MSNSKFYWLGSNNKEFSSNNLWRALELVTIKRYFIKPFIYYT